MNSTISLYQTLYPYELNYFPSELNTSENLKSKFSTHMDSTRENLNSKFSTHMNSTKSNSTYYTSLQIKCIMYYID